MEKFNNDKSFIAEINTLNPSPIENALTQGGLILIKLKPKQEKQEEQQIVVYFF